MTEGEFPTITERETMRNQPREADVLTLAEDPRLTPEQAEKYEQKARELYQRAYQDLSALGIPLEDCTEDEFIEELGSCFRIIREHDYQETAEAVVANHKSPGLLVLHGPIQGNSFINMRERIKKIFRATYRGFRWLRNRFKNYSAHDEYPEDITLSIADDVSYSGTQIRETLNYLLLHARNIPKNQPITIFLAGITKRAQKEIERIIPQGRAVTIHAVRYIPSCRELISPRYHAIWTYIELLQTDETSQFPARYERGDIGPSEKTAFCVTEFKVPDTLSTGGLWMRGLRTGPDDDDPAQLFTFEDYVAYQ